MNNALSDFRPGNNLHAMNVEQLPFLPGPPWSRLHAQSSGFVLVGMGFVIGLLGAALPRADAAELRAGFGVADISPDTTKHLVQLGGYGERNGKPALGIHDRTMAKAIVFSQGDRKFALLTLDLLGATRSLREEILKRMAGSGIVSENLLLAASHSHGSLEMNAMHRGNKFNNPHLGVFSEAMLQFTADRAASALQQACGKSVPVKAGTGARLIPGFNRNRRGGTLTDNEMTILRLDGLDGKPLAVWVNYTAHPTFMSEKDFYLSADWPGYLQRELEAFLPGTIALYANGAEGDVAPKGGEGPSSYARAEDYGRKIAIQALELIPKIKTAPDARLDFSMTMAQLPPRAIPPGLADAAGPEYGLTPENLKALLEGMSPTDTFVPSLRVGDFVAVGIPGEMISQLGLQIKDTLRQAGAPHPVIIGLANEWISYMLSPEEFHKGGYEPGVSFYGETLGPFMVEQGIASGKKMLKP